MILSLRKLTQFSKNEVVTAPIWWFQGTLETKEFKISEFMQEFGLTNEKLCVLAALLGNYLLPEKDLKDVLKKANINMEDYTKEQKVSVS